MNRRALYAFFEERSLRLTEIRRAFVRILTDAILPLSAGEILARLQDTCTNVNKTTVYRELERWEKLGLAEKVRLSGDEYSYELKRKHHHHVVCLSCQAVENVVLDEEKLRLKEAELRDEKNFLSIRHSLEFFGVCRKCQ